MNRYESVILDKMVALAQAKRFLTMDNRATEETEERILLLLDCIVDFREPPKEIPLEDGYGVMVNE